MKSDRTERYYSSKQGDFEVVRPWWLRNIYHSHRHSLSCSLFGYGRADHRFAKATFKSSHNFCIPSDISLLIISNLHPIMHRGDGNKNTPDIQNLSHLIQSFQSKILSLCSTKSRAGLQGYIHLSISITWNPNLLLPS